MRFSRIELLRYGKFEQHDIDFPKRSTDLHLIFGPNEAGKSTTRAALSDLLFGIEKATRYAFLHDYGRLRIGATIEEDQLELSFFRRKGTKGTLLDRNDSPLPDQALVPYLGHADRAFFERMFSLDHVSLVEGAKQLLDAKDDVGRLLFEASGGLHHLGNIRKSLDEEAESLWAPRRAKDRIYYTHFDQYQQAASDLERATVRVKDYRDAEQRVAVALQTQKELAEEQARLERHCTRLERIRRVAPGLLRLRKLDEDLSVLADVRLLPENALAIFQDAQTAIARSKSDLERSEQLIKKARAEVEKNSPSDVILRHSSEIRLLGERRAELRPYPEDLNKRRAEVAMLDGQIEELTSELGWPRLSIASIRERLPSLLDQESFERLLQQHEGITAKAAASEASLAKLRAELAELEQARDAKKARGAPDILRHVVEEANRLGDVDLRRRELQTQAELSKERLLAAFAQLLPWKGNLLALRSLATPDDVEVDQVSQRYERSQLDQDQARNDLHRERGKLEQTKLRQQQLSRDASPVTRQELDTARQKRETHWQTLRATWGSQGERVSPEEHPFRAFEDAVRAVDDLSDRRFEAATASAALQQLRADAEQIELRILQLEQQVERFEEQRKSLLLAVSELASGIGLPFDHPAKLRRWLGHRRDALELGNVAEQHRMALQVHEREVMNAEHRLRTVLEHCELAPEGAENSTFGALLRVAAAAAMKFDEERTRQQALLDQLRKAERFLPDCEEQHRKLCEQITVWQAAYDQHIQRFGLPEGTRTSVAKAALAILREISSLVSKRCAIQRERIETMLRDLEQFKVAVTATTERVGQALVSEDPFEHAQILTEQLDRETAIAALRAQAESALKQSESDHRESMQRYSAAEATIVPLFDLCQTKKLEELAIAIDRSNQKHDLQRKRDAQERAVLESGDGLSLTALCSEVDTEDPLALDSRLRELKEALGAMSLRRKNADLEHADAERALAAIRGEADAASAAARRNEALSCMTDTIDRYVRVRTTSVLLRWAIERFRREKQGPLLTQASMVFATLTLGNFTRLQVEFDERERPQLQGVRPNGSLVPLEAMSAGSTDQLYLALRIAALSLHLSQGKALPFVADDLFIHFDDARSCAAFRVLNDLARHTQVLFFTHHEHLLDVARRALGEEVPIVRLAG